MKAKGGGVYGEEIEGEVNLIYEWTLLQWNLIFIGHEKGKACAPNTEGRLKKNEEPRIKLGKIPLPYIFVTSTVNK